ncbi:hypothetical protein D3C80_2023220 [compost metagenome]
MLSEVEALIQEDHPLSSYLRRSLVPRDDKLNYFANTSHPTFSLFNVMLSELEALAQEDNTLWSYLRRSLVPRDDKLSWLLCNE